MRHAGRLLTRDDTAPLVHLQIGLCETARCMVGCSVHDLGARSDCVHLCIHTIFLSTRQGTLHTTDPQQSPLDIHGHLDLPVSRIDQHLT